MENVATIGWQPTAELRSLLAPSEVKFESSTIAKLLTDAQFSVAVIQFQKNTSELLNFFSELYKKTPRPAVVLLAHASDLEKVISTLCPNSFELLVSSSPKEQYVASIKKAIQLYHAYYKPLEAHESAFEGLVSTSTAMRAIYRTIEKVAAFSTTVLIQGESGTGKELVARAIHRRSARSAKPFIAVNCGAIPENLLESEFFGHRRGSFTDASRDKKGLFEEAQGGTILLDEIGELPLHLQVKLLRALQEQVIRPIGSSESIPIDVRIIAATLRNLEADVEEGRFRDDLYYRLNVVPIPVPALRERPEDIEVLIQHFLIKHRAKLGLGVYSIADDARTLLHSYAWPGNIRELENTIERAMILSAGEQITSDALPLHIRERYEGVAQREASFQADPLSNLSIKIHSRQLETQLIQKALAQTGGNRTQAAKLLEISHRTLLYKLKEYGLNEDAGE